ncbi:hypothetical protein LWI28_001801 [Acer negundo]|uniref:Uncharacterized protein n=1 Tax=Acer negundo TaxID=4023 RepID=A0AAD5ISC8_ACENE|nr:hypothetical protein LWI28_001801 [Acer negundo]
MPGCLVLGINDGSLFSFQLGILHPTHPASPSVMYPAVILPAAPLVSSSPSSVSPTTNVGISLGSSRPTDTPPLTLAKSQTSLLAKLSTPPTARSPLIKMTVKASRVRSILGQIQRKAPSTYFMKHLNHSPGSPPPPSPIVPSRSQLRVDRAKETVKKLVVGPWVGSTGPPRGVHRSARPFCRRCAPGLNWPGRASGAVTLKKLECSKQAYALDTLAWDNIIGFRSYSVGLRDRTFAKDVFINQERKLGARRRSDTVLVSTINDADQGSADVTFRTPLAPYEKSKSLGSGGSMVARLKLKGIDGRAPPGVEPAA